MNFLLKVTKNGRKVNRYETHFINRFNRRLRSINWQDGIVLTRLRVSYGKSKNVFGNNVYFTNEGIYKNESDLLSAFSAFTEKEE